MFTVRRLATVQVLCTTSDPASACHRRVDEELCAKNETGTGSSYRGSHIRFCLGLLGALGRFLEEVFDDLFQRVDVHVLARVSILHQGFLGVAAHPLLYAQVDEPVDDVLEPLDPGSMSAARQDIVQR